jgi:hypothetical protein
VRKGVLPKKVDKDPDWRAIAIYDRSEIQLLIFDTRVLQDRRVVYALKALAAGVPCRRGKGVARNLARPR